MGRTLLFGLYERQDGTFEEKPIQVNASGALIISGTGGGGGASAADIGAEVDAALKASAQPIVQSTVTLTDTVVSLPANTSAVLVVANPNRKTLSFMNIGPNPATVTPGTAAAVVGRGPAFNGANSAGEQGGAYSFDGASCPTVQFTAISTLGTTFVVWEGV